MPFTQINSRRDTCWWKKERGDRRVSEETTLYGHVIRLIWFVQLMLFITWQNTVKSMIFQTFFFFIRPNWNFSEWKRTDFTYRMINPGPLTMSIHFNIHYFPIEKSQLTWEKLNEFLLRWMEKCIHVSKANSWTLLLLLVLWLSQRCSHLLHLYRIRNEKKPSDTFSCMICVNICRCIYRLRRYTSFHNVDKFKILFTLLILFTALSDTILSLFSSRFFLFSFT